MTSVTNALGEVTSFTWGRRQTLRTTTLPEEPGEPVSTWTSTWNADGKLVAQADPLGHETTFEGFDNFGNPTTVRDALGHASHQVFDSRGFAWFEIDAEGVRTTYQRDLNGNVLSATLEPCKKTTSASGCWLGRGGRWISGRQEAPRWVPRRKARSDRS